VTGPVDWIWLETNPVLELPSIRARSLKIRGGKGLMRHFHAKMSEIRASGAFNTAEKAHFRPKMALVPLMLLSAGGMTESGLRLN